MAVAKQTKSGGLRVMERVHPLRPSGSEVELERELNITRRIKSVHRCDLAKSASGLRTNAAAVKCGSRIRHAESGCVESVKEFRADFLHDDVGVGFAIE